MWRSRFVLIYAVLKVVGYGVALDMVKIATSNSTVLHRGRHNFFRSMDGSTPGAASRRMFGGNSAELSEYPAVCALLDRYWSARCSASVLTPHWVLTAAHCVSTRLAYVKYNSRRPASEGDVTPVHYLYRHPKFEVKQADEGRGVDVTVLHHDVGLVRTRNKMELTLDADLNTISDMRLYNVFDLQNKNVKVLGFGRTERSVLGEELFSVELHLSSCDREGWYHCVCGVTLTNDARGVCSGDSGGPVLYQGVQVGVTSMGPVECAHPAASPPSGSSSVFTTLYQYADVVNVTITDAEAALRMRMISQAQTYTLAITYVFLMMLHLLSMLASR